MEKFDVKVFWASCENEENELISSYLVPLVNSNCVNPKSLQRHPVLQKHDVFISA